MIKRLFSLIMLVFVMIFTAQNSYAVPINYTATLTGPNEEPPNTSPATGTSEVVIDTEANTLSMDVIFAGLLGTTTAAHIHGPTAVPGDGVAPPITQVPSLIGFPLGVTSGTYTNTFDTCQASTYNPAFIAAAGGTVALAEAALAASLAEGTAYFNIHSTLFPEGEIRGFLHPSDSAPAPVPEPGTLMLLGSSLIGMIGLMRRRMKQES